MNTKGVVFSLFFLAVLLGVGLYFYFESETKTANKIDTSEEHKIMQELVRYDMADSLLKDPKELDITFDTIEFESSKDDIYISEFLVNGEYQGKSFKWRVWKNTQENSIWGFSARECISGCPDSEVFSTKDEMKTFMELHWLKMEHNRLVDECKCSNVALRIPDLPIIEVTDDTRDYIKDVKGYKFRVEEERSLIDDNVEIIEENAVLDQVDLLDEEAYAYLLKDLSRYLHFHLMRYDEVVKTYGVSSDEMIALNNEAEVYEYDEGGSYVGILSNIDYYNHPIAFDEGKIAFKELLVHVYRLYQFSWLHALHQDSTNEFLNDVEAEKKAINSVYNKNKSIFEKYNLNESLFNLESKTEEKEKNTIEKETDTEEEIQKNEVKEETVESKIEKPVAICGNGEALFTRSLNSHSITIHAENANFSNLQGGYAGGNEGDRIADGTFSLCVDSTQKLPIPVMSFNLERDHMVYALNGEPGLFVVEEYGTSNGNFAYLYTFNDGLLQPVNLETGEQGVFTGTKLKNSGPGMYQYMYYDNTTFSYFLYEIKISGTQASVVQYAEMADGTIYDQFNQDPKYIYTP